jgi:hypothetical protein
LLCLVVLSESEISLIRTKSTITWYFKATIEASGSLVGQLGVDKVPIDRYTLLDGIGTGSPVHNTSWGQNILGATIPADVGKLLSDGVSKRQGDSLLLI